MTDVGVYEAMALMQRGIATRDDLIEALRAVVVEYPYYWDYAGSMVCFWCRETEGQEHQPDCQWAMARAALAEFDA